jgi:uncharacterized repeat protein (TIGR03803 family)
LTIDRAGNLYGTAYAGGASGQGTVYQLTHKSSGWIFTPLYGFTGGNDGAHPIAGVIMGPDGALYGTTTFGGNPSCDSPLGCGTVFKLRPPATGCRTALCPWTETVLHAFQEGDDGDGPGFGDLLFDQAGNIYGTTISGGVHHGGVVYELRPSGSGWTESVLYSFAGGSGGNTPYAGVILDNADNLYGTTFGGGLDSSGTVYKLVHSMGWAEEVLYSFMFGDDGGYPLGGLISDQSGNLYGTTASGAKGAGTAFKLSPSGSGWTFSLLYSFIGGGINCGPSASLAMDAAGNLYGTTVCAGKYGLGSVFKLTPSSPYWTYTSLHDFTGGSDGEDPMSDVVFDANGHLYGTTTGSDNGNCYNSGCGVVWEITP